ncbi:MAG: MFS transporter [Microthrixaceae bacterium]|nr:MFS transporter [Microthrixaceae bacterium]
MSAVHPEREGTRWVPVLVLLACGVAAAMMFAKVAAIFVPLREHYASDDVLIGLAISLPGLLACILGVTAGVLVGELGARRVLLVCMAAGAALSLVQGLALPLWLFLVTRTVEGIAHLGVVVAAPVLIIGLSAPHQRGLVMAIWGSFFGTAFALTGWLAPLVAARGGPGLVFTAHGVLMAALIALALGLLPRTLGAPIRGAQLSWRRFGAEHLASYRNPRALLPGAIFVWHTLMYTSLVTFIPLFGGPADVGMLLIWMPLVSILGTLAAGVAIRILPRPALVAATGFVVVAALALALWWAIAGGFDIVALALVLMWFSGLIQGAAFSLIPALSADPAINARANGTITQLGNLGNLLGSPLFAAALTGGALGALGEFGTMALLVLALCIAGVACCAITLRWMRRHGAPPPPQRARTR